ncbi:hypothetical protein D9615_001321 [Tricholomella constricta]|uniref:Ion transport domain-containing protein n=1 Tax=Tricholomella constricta TaxID=117010 RepID=A0A8H5HLG1_9AGAR|nr:hypothetical protein D9615_001321 [Tricholomella constricta]
MSRSARDNDEYREFNTLNGDSIHDVEAGRPGRSMYALTRGEITRGLANRFVHSRIYICLYLGMAALSVTTVILSLRDGCPGLAFFILEVIINTSMIIEVTIRFIAFGKQFWKSPFNVMDLILTFFCALTLLVITFAKCGAGSKEEAILDTLLLVTRNVLQFGRLAAVMRQSGQSIFSQPKPIDISSARRAGFMDLEIETDDEDDDVSRPLVRNPVLFDIHGVNEELEAFTDMPRAVEAAGDRDSEETWARLG